MTPDEIATVLQTAFQRCDAANCPLTGRQKEIFLQLVQEIQRQSPSHESDTSNPLDELTSAELEIFLAFVQTEEQQNRTWKAQLLNDWLNNQDSGEVQFIRERYGLQWLNRVESFHFRKYANFEDTLKLKVGDRIEVANALWEWVQNDGPCQREWFLAIVIKIDQINNGDNVYTNCCVRFDNATEYEIPGVYEWNRYNWRWPQK